MLCKLHYTLPSQREFGPPVIIYAVRATFRQKRGGDEEKILQDKHFAALTVSSFFASIVVISSLRG